jgi:hypothetical protein
MDQDLTGFRDSLVRVFSDTIGNIEQTLHASKWPACDGYNSFKVWPQFVEPPWCPNCPEFGRTLWVWFEFILNKQFKSVSGWRSKLGCESVVEVSRERTYKTLQRNIGIIYLIVTSKRT